MISVLNKLFKSLILATALLCIVSMDAQAQTAQEFFDQGNALYNQKKFAEAVASYGRAIQLQPQSFPKAYLNCARAYSMLKNYPASAQYYSFYQDVAPDADSDRKFKAEFKAVEHKAKKEPYVRDSAQTAILNQLMTVLNQNGPYMARQGNSVMAHYDILMRSGYAEPDLYNIQRKIVGGLSSEIDTDTTPPPGQPMPNLDRTGWEYVHTKISRLRQFVDVQPDNERLNAIETMATAWESYYRGDYDTARTAFEEACKFKPDMPAAHWGRLMLNFQLEKNDVLLDQIEAAEKIYKDAGITNTSQYFSLLRAQAYRNIGDISRSLEWLSAMQGAL